MVSRLVTQNPYFQITESLPVGFSSDLRFLTLERLSMELWGMVS